MERTATRVALAFVLLMVGEGVSHLSVGGSESPERRESASVWFVLPLDTFYLTANFGELRATHFHAGVDMGSGGRVGMPVRSVFDGYVSRISVAPSGYGIALYITDNSGTYTAVYAHLLDFAGSIKEYVYRWQKHNRQNTFDIYLSEGTLPVRAGEVVAFLGNSGASTAPHLHFELRLAAGNCPINPAEEGMSFADSYAPRLTAVGFVAGCQRGGVFTRFKPYRHLKVSSRTRELHVAVPEGWWGLQFRAWDYLDGNRIAGVAGWRVVVGGEVRFELFPLAFSYDDIREAVAYKDGQWLRAFRPPATRGENVRDQRQGFFYVGRDSVVEAVLVVCDPFSNCDSVRVKVKGMASTQGDFCRADTTFLLWNEPVTLSDTLSAGYSVVLEMPAGTLAEDGVVQLRECTSYPPSVAACVEVFSTVPWLKKARLVFKPAVSDTSFRYVVLANRVNGEWRQVSAFIDGQWSGEVRAPGVYALVLDTLSPRIAPLNFSSGAVVTHKPYLEVRITDEIMPLSDWAVYINGEWEPAYWDMKTRRLQLYLRRIPAGDTLTVRVVATDASGNQSETAYQVVY